MDATLHIIQKSGAVLFLRMFAIGILFTVADCARQAFHRLKSLPHKSHWLASTTSTVPRKPSVSEIVAPAKHGRGRLRSPAGRLH